MERNLHPPTIIVDLRACLKSSEFPGSDSKFHENSVFSLKKTRMQCVFFQINKKACFFLSQKVENSGKIMF